MATDLTAKLTLEAQASGQDSLRQMAGEVRSLGKGAGDAAPQFAALADELDELGRQQALIDGFREAKRATADLQAQLDTATTELERLADEQSRAAQAAQEAAAAQAASAERLAQARATQREYKDALALARAELAALSAASKVAGADTAVLRDRMGDAKGQVAALQASYRDAGAQVKTLAAAHKDSAAAARQAATAQRGVTADYERTLAVASQLSGQLGAQNRVLDDTRQAMQRVGLSSQQLQQAQALVNQRMDAAQDKARTVAVLYGGMGKAAEQAARASGQAARDTSRQWGDVANKVTAVQGAVAGLFAIGKLKAMAGDAIATADAFGEMAERVRMASADQQEFEQVQGRLLQTANNTYRALKEQQEMYIRSADALRSMGYNTEQVLDITDSFSYLLTTNAASAERAEAAVGAYTKAVQTGRIESDGWQSMLAATPTLVEAIASATGKTTEEVRKLGITGKLSVRDLNEGLRQTVAANQEAVAGMSTTVADAVRRLSNTWGEWLRNVNESSGATQFLVRLTDFLADNLDTLVGVAMKAGMAVAAVFGMRALTAVRGYTAALMASARAHDALIGSAGRAGTAMNALGLAMQRFGGIARGIGHAAIAEQLLKIALAYAEIRKQQQLQAQLADSVADKDARIAQRLRDISQATGVAVTSMEALNAAQAAGMLVFDEAAGRWLSAAQAQQQLGLAAENTADRLAGLNAAAAVEQFHAIVEESGKAEEALKKLVEGLRFDDATSVAGFTRALEALRNGGTLTAQQVGDAWQQALAKLDAGQIDRVRTQLEAAAAQGVISAQQLAQANDQILTASFARLGVNSAQALGQISKGAQDAIGSVALVMETLDAAGAQSEEAARAIELAFAAAVPKADSLEAVAALERQLAAVGESGKIGAAGLQRVQEALDRQRAAIHDQLPGIQSLGEALRQLGVKPQAELNALARSARAAFEAVKASGTATPREIREAWRAMAEAAIEANGGFADEALKAQAAQHGLMIQTDAAGKAVVVSMDQATEAVNRYREAAERAGLIARGAGDQAAEGADKAAKGADKAREAHKQAAQAIEFTWLSARTQASQYADEAARHAETMVGTLQKYLGTGMSWNQYIGAWNSYYGDLRRMAEEYAAALEGIDARQQALERRNSGAAKGVDDLRMRLLELSGSEEEIAQARAARDRAEVERQIQLAQLEAERASVRGDHGAAQRFAEEVALLQEQLSLLGQIERAEKRQRKERSQSGGGAGGGGGSGSSGSGGGKGGGMAAPNVNITLNANGVNDPARLARMIEPELKRPGRLAR